MNLAVGANAGSRNRIDGRAQLGQKRLFITGGTGFFGKSMLVYRLRHMMV